MLSPLRETVRKPQEKRLYNALLSPRVLHGETTNYIVKEGLLVIYSEYSNLSKVGEALKVRINA